MSFCTRTLESDDYGSLEVVNLFASTGDKKNSLKPSQKVFERKNLEYIRDAVGNPKTKILILAWGKGGQVVSEHQEFKKLLKKHAKKLRCIGLTTDKKRQPNYYYAPRREAKLKKCIVLEHGYDAIDI
ncbi:DUF1643 domain-containing protein (plasmid) [Alicyclobacillus fastidiosus]|uniref:DUF1643 domain-containing protein n=1 Tax=Alicyclobacillus fastidiosus TaxID=392011 RepID=A0ABY6ZRR2_9BACL|nr:DUF1643 domain-containing protein [Alicyclobacillus fastidiosus]WAH44789.1 DUF1643 domain-containing protein [Alicyclobacillus fastidiosus]GMA65744.1 hypothetical protein GCM10025859_61840 [Alicyclobacillus fastidiosus]GMA65918.1 hypothetical protein GCM10025859_63590 [Alicyclobacillus fastidiosus]